MTVIPEFDERYRLKSINHALDVLEALNDHPDGMGVTELAGQLGLTKGAVHRILTNLAARSYVRRLDEQGRYCLGVKLWELGTSLAGGLGLREAAGAHMHELTRLAGESTHLAIYDAGAVVYLDKVSTQHAVQAYTRVGGRAPAYCVATGKALLAFQPAEELGSVLASGLARHTELTLTDFDELNRELEQIRHQGFAVNRGEWRSDVIGVAAPVRDASGAVVAAIGISGPSYRFSIHDAESAAPALLAATGSVSHSLGYVPDSHTSTRSAG